MPFLRHSKTSTRESVRYCVRLADTCHARRSTLLILALLSTSWAGPPQTDGDALEQVLVSELERANAHWATLETGRPHYVAVAIEDRDEITLRANDGALSIRNRHQSRTLDVDLRVGTPELDSTHTLRGFSALEGEERGHLRVPLGEGYALRHALWRELEARYRDATERIVVIRANRNVKVAEEASADDFSPGQGIVDRGSVPVLAMDEAEWEADLLAVAARLHAVPEASHSSVAVAAAAVRDSFVDTEGARIVHGIRRGRVTLIVGATAEDGDEVQVFRTKDVHDLERLPDRETLLEWSDQVASELRARLQASRGTPYSGPVILTGKASGVFFHEVLGHRVEGHRQKREDEGRTFAEQVGRRVLPSWIDVYDDPTLDELAGEQLNGNYAYDDEGTPAARAPIVDDGVFVGFLMHRSPIPGFDRSNGHGRRSTGNPPLARMGNTVIEASRTVSQSELRRRLLREVRRQRLEYGYIVDEIEGGFTMTGRVTPNAFNVRASTTWRVYADGRPDELVRGLDLVGTPLVAFSNILAAGREAQVFNGTCGAESGWVPVSAVAPSLLFSRLEFQLKEKGQERPPLLVKPAQEPAS